MRSSVVFPIAETTTTTSSPPRRVRAMWSATARMRSASATELPPNFRTARGTATTYSPLSANFMVHAERQTCPSTRTQESKTCNSRASGTPEAAWTTHDQRARCSRLHHRPGRDLVERLWEKDPSRVKQHDDDGRFDNDDRGANRAGLSSSDCRGRGKARDRLQLGSANLCRCELGLRCDREDRSWDLRIQDVHRYLTKGREQLRVLGPLS